MHPVFHLRRAPSDLDAWDRDAVRAWVLDRVRNEVVLRGAPHPAVLLVGDGFVESLDLDQVQQQDLGAHAGATFKSLRARPDVEHRFLVLVLIATDREQKEHLSALVLQQGEEDGNTGIWLATLPYTVDPSTGVGLPAERWSTGDLPEGAQLPPMLQEMVAPPEEARAACVLPPRPRQPDIRTAFGQLPSEATLPETAPEQADLVVQMAVPEILREGLMGIVVLRFHAREWQWWLLGEDQPAELDDMVRYICHREPEADGVAVVMVALFGGSQPPQPGIQIIAERAGARAERWALLEFPQGPAGPKHVSRVVGRDNKPPAEGEAWLGVEPLVFFELTMQGAVEE